MSLRLSKYEVGYNIFQECYSEVNDIFMQKYPDTIKLFLSQTGKQSEMSFIE
jgi:hypothetical protein